MNVVRVKRETQFTKSSVYFGRLTPRRQSRLGFRQAGTLKNVFKNLGDAAFEGEKLAELDQTLLENQRLELGQSISRLEQQFQNSSQAESEELKNLRGQMKRIELELANGMIVAPYDCIVSTVDVNPGDLVSPQRPAFEVVENAPAIVEADLPVDIADSLTIGQSVWVTIGKTILIAKVQTKSPTMSTVGNKRVTLGLSADSEKTTTTMFGQTVKVEFLSTTAADGFWIPQSALIGQSNGLWSILVVSGAENARGQNAKEEGLVEQKLLEVISIKDDWVFVDANLSAEELVISNGSHRIVPGQRIIVNDVTSELVVPDGGNAR